MGQIVQYKHHGKVVSVDQDLLGKHRAHCLCHRCEKFTPDDGDRNCPIASLLFSACRAFNIITPVWECPAFKEK